MKFQIPHAEPVSEMYDSGIFDPSFVFNTQKAIFSVSIFQVAAFTKHKFFFLRSWL